MVEGEDLLCVCQGSEAVQLHHVGGLKVLEIVVRLQLGMAQEQQELFGPNNSRCQSLRHEPAVLFSIWHESDGCSSLCRLG